MPLWKRIGFIVFNVGGLSLGSVAPFFEFYGAVHVGWLWLLWISVLAFSISTSLLVGQRAWERVVAERASLEDRLRPILRFYFSSECCLLLPERRIFFGVHNPSAQTINDAEVRITVTSARTRSRLLPCAC